jgi:HEAT repeat protein
LKRALNNSANTAVTRAAAEALLERFDRFSMEALTEAFGSEDVEVSQTVADVLLGASERGRFARGLLDEGS